MVYTYGSYYNDVFDPNQISGHGCIWYEQLFHIPEYHAMNSIINQI